MVFGSASVLQGRLSRQLPHPLPEGLRGLRTDAQRALRSFAEQYGPAERDELLATLQDEAERLNRFVGNLLDMTRLEAGAIELKLHFMDIAEITGARLRRAQPSRTRRNTLTAKIPTGHQIGWCAQCSSHIRSCAQAGRGRTRFARTSGRVSTRIAKRLLGLPAVPSPGTGRQPQ